VVDAQGNAKSGVVARLAARGAPIVGYAAAEVRERANLAFTTHRAPPSGESHGARRALGLLRALGTEPPAGPPDYALESTEAERRAAADLLRAAGADPARPLCLLHPGKPADLRAWTPRGNLALGRSLLARGWEVVVEGPDPARPAEARAARRSLMAAGARDLGERVPLRSLLGLVDLLARERRSGSARVLVSPDTLLPHLAAALGLPVVLVAGPQDPRRTGPLGAGPAEAVHAWEGLPCAPCRKRRCANEVDRACMERLEPQTVLAAVQRLLPQACGGPAT
jgi:ADP-heptose:LPS heptosyltransferase